MSRTELVYLDKDDTYMYFEVFHDKLPRGTIFVEWIKPLHHKESMNKGDKVDFSSLIVPPKQSENDSLNTKRSEKIWYWYQNLSPELVKGNHWIEFEKLLIIPKELEDVSDLAVIKSMIRMAASDSLPRTKNCEHKWFYTNSRKRICEDCGEIQFFKEGAWY